MIRALALVIILPATLAAADFKEVNRTVSLSQTGAVTVQNHKGSIHVSTWDRPEVEIKARIEAEPGSSMDRRRFDGTDVEISASQDSVRIATHYPDINWDHGSNPEVRYEIRMPRTARLTIRDHRSEIGISGLQGALDLETHRRIAHVHGLSGPLTVNTHRGGIDVEFASFSGHSSVTTHRGSIQLTMPKASAFDLEADLGKHASMQSDFSMMTRLAGKRGQNLHGAVNGGGATLRVDTYRGEIRLRAI